MKVLIFLLVIFSSTYAVKFNCTYSIINYAVVGERYTCTAILLSFEEGPVLTGVFGNHLYGRNNSNVVAVVINNQITLNFIPQQMQNFFPLLGAITVYNCNLTLLNRNDLRHYSNLEYLNLYYNRIQLIPGGFFDKAPRMRYINFNNNQIKHVGENLIEPLFSLNHAHFSANDCISFAVTNSTFGCLIGTLRVHCRDIDNEITTTYRTTDLTSPSSPTTTIPEPACNMHDSVCIIENQNSDIKKNIEKLTGLLEELLHIVTP